MGFMEKKSIYESIKYVIPDPFEGERYELVKLFYPMDIYDGQGRRSFSECGKNIVIKGDAGSGKTTLLKRLCIFFMHKEENANEDEILKEKYGLTPEYTPLFLKLRRLKKYGYSFDALLNDSCEAGSLSGKIILLLDGMDEIPDERREVFLRELDGFQREHDDMRIIISGRFVGFEGAGVKAKLSEMGFVEMKIRPLTDDQIYEYGCERLNLRAEKEQSCAVLKSLIDGETSDILRKPLSLEIILRRISEGEDVTFTDRNGIFREMITGLIGGRESGEARECVCRDSLNILGALAFFVVDSDGLWADEGILLNVNDAIRDMTFCSEKMKPGNMEELKVFLEGVAQNTGLLEESVETDGDVYAFPIRAYMEYLCAYACCNLSFRGKNGLDPLPCIEAKLNNTMWQGCVTFILSDMEKNRHKDFCYAVKYVFENMESESGLKDIITSGVVVDLDSALCLCRRFFVMTHPLDTDLLFSCIKSDHAAVWKSAVKQLFTEAMEDYRPCGDCRDVYKPYLTAYSYILFATDPTDPDPVRLLMSNRHADNILGAQVISVFVSICLGEMMPHLEGVAAAGLEACVNVTGRLRDLFKETGDFIFIKALSDMWVSYGGDEKPSEKSLAVSNAAEKAISEDMVLHLAEMVDNSEDIFLDTWELSMENSREMINADATATLIATLGAMPFSEKLFKNKIKNLNSYAFIRGQFKYLGDLWMIERVGSAFAGIYVYRNMDRFLDIWEAVVGDVVRLKECGKRGAKIYRIQSRFLKEKGWVRQVPVTKMV